MSERTDRDERADPTDGAAEPGIATPHRPWVRVVTVVVLVAFVLSILVSALLV